LKLLSPSLSPVDFRLLFPDSRDRNDSQLRSPPPPNAHFNRLGYSSCQEEKFFFQFIILKYEIYYQLQYFPSLPRRGAASAVGWCTWSIKNLSYHGEKVKRTKPSFLNKFYSEANDFKSLSGMPVEGEGALLDTSFPSGSMIEKCGTAVTPSSEYKCFF